MSAAEPSCKGLRVAQVVATRAFAGTERYAANLADGLSQLGAEVIVVGGEPARMSAALAGTAPGLTHLPGGNVVEAARQLHRARPLDIVHAHLTPAELAAAAVFPTRSRTAVVSTRHIAAHRGSSTPARLASRWVKARLDGQVAISEYVAARVEGCSRVIPTGVHDQPAGPHDQPVVLVAQRLEPEKDTATALRAWACSQLEDQGWQLHIAGSGAEEPRLRALAGELGIERSCHFLGQVADTRLRFARAAMLLATATGEPFGLSVVEAMAAGLPVVAAAAGGHLETLGPVAGAVLFTPGDHAGAGRLLRTLAEDGRRRAADGNSLRGRQRSEYSFDNFLAKVVAWYREVLSPRQPDHSPPRGALREWADR
ncbi:MAG: glycosyltransferase family 4 protein [Acidimicrobiales bacterium]